MFSCLKNIIKEFVCKKKIFVEKEKKKKNAYIKNIIYYIYCNIYKNTKEYIIHNIQYKNTKVCIYIFKYII